MFATSVNSDLRPIASSRTPVEVPTPFLIKVQRIWDFINECMIKEFSSCIMNFVYRVAYILRPHAYDLNPENVKRASIAKQQAKVVMLLHGSSASPSYFFPLAKKLQNAKIGHVYTVNIKPSENDPVPSHCLSSRIKEVTKKYLNKGYGGVEYAFVGHSLGSLVATKYIWRGSQVEKTKVSMMISIAGRLKYAVNKFAWFCGAVKSEINMTYTAIEKDPNKTPLYTIWGDQDAIVPKESAHFQNRPDREYTVKGAGHGGIVMHPDAIRQTVVWIKSWAA